MKDCKFAAMLTKPNTKHLLRSPHCLKIDQISVFDNLAQKIKFCTFGSWFVVKQRTSIPRQG
eukprot:7691465-Karenia_brevis.AAC.1